MTRRSTLTEGDLAYQIQTHLLYELRWLIYAADAFQHAIQRANDDSYMAYLDSAAIHARNLLQWAGDSATHQFSLGALGGKTAKLKDWERWVNNRVAHMSLREHEKARWPEGYEAWNRPDKLMRMAKVVLDRLRDGSVGIRQGKAGDAYKAVLASAENYWGQPTQTNCRALIDLHDGSRDQPYPK